MNFVLRMSFVVLLIAAQLEQYAQAEQSANHQLFFIRPDGTDLKQITQRTDDRFGAPVVSPDGKHIAADCAPAHQTLQDTHIVVMDADGSNLRDLCPGSMPAWSPNSRLLAFHTYSPPGAIMVMDADGAGAEEVTNHWGSPRWSPKGDKILCLKPDQTFHIVDLTTGRETAMIVPSSYRAYQGFSLSPTGSRICFGDMIRGGISVGRVKNWQISRLEHFLPNTSCTFCSWSPDGTRIVFSMISGDNGQMSQLYILDTKSKGPPRRLQGQNADAANVNPQWSPDGEWIVFSSDLPE